MNCNECSVEVDTSKGDFQNEITSLCQLHWGKRLQWLRKRFPDLLFDDREKSALVVADKETTAKDA